ncbi:hypothetical protein EYF80_000375 [Liparis tanakae]|uniref:Uncharacterized protein n=1 Tax=Liparis tanakae TaxID=230148 RepID=A0A4Z2JGK7_9TELE|nr:hypothetical protein EYF80_000375 [Liparis tanakae]
MTAVGVKWWHLTGQRPVESVGLQACRSSSIQKSMVSCLGDFTSGVSSSTLSRRFWMRLNSSLWAWPLKRSRAMRISCLIDSRKYSLSTQRAGESERSTILNKSANGGSCELRVQSNASVI